MRRIGTCIVVGILMLAARPVSAMSHQVTIDLTGLGGSGFQLQVALYDNSGILGDSWALIDNVALGSTVDDFEDGTLGGFDASLNPGSVAAVAGDLDGTGIYIMQIDEDPVFTPTVAYRDYLSPDGNLLTFDLDMTASSIESLFGLDELVVSLLDPDTLDPLVPGLNGFGDVLSLSAEGLRFSDEVTIGTVPAPAAFLLGLIGAGGVSVFGRRRH